MTSIRRNRGEERAGARGKQQKANPVALIRIGKVQCLDPLTEVGSFPAARTASAAPAVIHALENMQIPFSYFDEEETQCGEITYIIDSLRLRGKAPRIAKR